MQVEGLILAGGKSSRMGGCHKGSLTYKRESFTQILVKELRKEAACVRLSYGQEKREDQGEYPVVMDIYSGCGPIGGIHAGLKACGSEWLLVAACDMPFLKIELFRYMMDEFGQKKTGDIRYDGVVPVTDGRIHPLAAIYRTGMTDILEEQIKREVYCIRDALKRLNILYIDVAGKKMFEQMLRNINTQEEYERLREYERADIEA